MCPRSLLETVLAALQRKKNLILQGPPGVGKTFAARHIGFALLGELDHSRLEMIQFLAKLLSVELSFQLAPVGCCAPCHLIQLPKITRRKRLVATAK
jgi:predicted ATPase with chaperone activity